VILVLVENSKHPYSNIDIHYEIWTRLIKLLKILAANIFAITIVRNQINVSGLLKESSENSESK